MKTNLTEEQVSKLKSLHFWRRNLLIAKQNEDRPEINKSRQAIKMLFQDADKMQIPYPIQNKVLYAAQEGICFCDMEEFKPAKIEEEVYN